MPNRSKILNAIILDALPVAVFGKSIKDSYRFSVWNKHAEKLFGLEKAQVLGKTDYDLFPKDQADFFRMKDEATVRAGEVVKIDEEPVGEKTWVRTQKFTICDETGQPELLLGICEDITASREAKLKVHSADERLRLCLSAVKMAVWDWDLVQNVINWNDSVKVSREFLRDPLLTNPRRVLDDWKKAIHPEDRVRLQQEVDEAIEYRQHLNTRYRIITRSGAVRMISTKARIERDESGVAIHMRGVNIDITQEAEQEELIRNQAIQIHSNAKFSALGELAGGIAHEINNPLTIIIGKAQNLLQMQADGVLNPGNIDEKLQENLGKIIATSQRISKVVRGLKAISRNAEYDAPERTLIYSILEDALDLCREKFKNHGIMLTTKWAQGTPEVMVRPAQIAQVLVNLFNNAFDAMQALPRGGAEKWVRVQTQFVDGKIQIWVQDCGGGISPQIVSRMMDPFFTTKEVGKGTGLGLSISQSIAESHGGRLYYDSAQAHTTFVLELQVLQPTSGAESAA